MIKRKIEKTDKSMYYDIQIVLKTRDKYHVSYHFCYAEDRVVLFGLAPLICS
jgi:hypothetical protein